MFVIEHGHGAAALFEHAYRLLEKFVAWIQRLRLFIPRISAVFADDQHAIDCKFGAAQSEGFGDRRINSDSVSARAVAAEVAFGKLVHVERGQFHRRTMMAALPPIPFEEAVDEMLRVRHSSYLGCENSDALPARG